MTEILKAFTELIKAFKELLEVGGKMAGGRIRGQIVFWVLFIIIIAALLKPSYDSVNYVLGQLGMAMGVKINLATLLLALLVAIITTIGVIGLGGAIGMLLAAFANFVFAPRTRNDIDSLLVRSTAILEKASVANIDNQAITDLITEAKQLQRQWASSRTYKFLKWTVRNKKRGN